ncbi:MAG: ribonuclease P protein component [Thermodesulfobacteriota bacterium]
MKGQGFSWHSRLHKPQEFERVYRGGRRLKGDGFQLILLPNSLEQNRLGISLNRRIKGAVRRNRIKRLIREFFRCHQGLIPPAQDCVFAVRPEFGLDHPAAIHQAVASLLASRRGGGGSQAGRRPQQVDQAACDLS